MRLGLFDVLVDSSSEAHPLTAKEIADKKQMKERYSSLILSLFQKVRSRVAVLNGNRRSYPRE